MARSWTTGPAIALTVATLAAIGCGTDSHDEKSSLPKNPAGLETCQTTLATLSHTAAPGAGPARLGDDDSDGNGILDRDEWGPDQVMPVDSDGDAVGDYRDADDDGDGLRDVHDSERLTPLVESDPFADERLLIGSANVQVGERELRGVARAGDTLVVRGEGLGCDAVIAFLGTDGPINVVPKAARQTELHVVVPEGAGEGLVVTRSGRFSNTFALQVVAATAPVLFEPTPRAGGVGALVAFHGENLQAIDSVWFGSVRVKVESAVQDRVDVVLPPVPSGSRVKASIGLETFSNALAFRVLRPVPVSIPAVAAGTYAAGEIRIFQFWSDEIVPSSDGQTQVQVGADRFDVVRTLIERGGQTAPVYEALVLPQDGAISLDAGSTAVSIVLGRSLSLARVHHDSYATLRAKANGLPSVAALASALDIELGQNVFARAEEAPVFLEQLGPALLALESAIEAGLADGSLKPPPVKAAFGGLEDFLAQHEVPFADSEVGPEVTIDPEEQWFFRVSSPPGSGNVRISNGSSLYASARIVDRETGVPLTQHTKHAFGKSILVPDSLGIQSSLPLIGGDPTTDFDQPKFRDARVELITGGWPDGASPEDGKLALMLWLRGFFDSVVYPMLEYVIGGVVDPGVAWGLFINHAKDLLQETLQAHTSGDGPSPWGVLLGRFISELQSGPLLPALTEHLLTKEAKKQAVLRAGQLVVPGIREATAIFKTVELVTKGVGIGRWLLHQTDMPTRLDSDVSFGLGITKVLPADIPQSCNGTIVDVHGAGFRPKTVNGATQYVVATMFDASGEEPLVYQAQQEPRYELNETGTLLTFEMPGEFSARALNPIGIAVAHGSEFELKEPAINVTNPLELLSISPNTGTNGDVMTLVGGGYALPGTVAVTFEEANPPVGIAKSITVTTFSSISDTEIELVVPELPSDETDWNVRVTRIEKGCEFRSVALPFSTESKSCLVDLHALVQNPTTKSFALDVNQNGAVLVNVNTTSTTGTWSPFVVAADESVSAVPCAGKSYADALDDQGRVAGSSGASPAWLWDPSAPSGCGPLSGSASLIVFGIANGTVVGTDSARAAIWPNLATKVVIPYTSPDPIPRWANDINQAGAVVGYADKLTRTGFLWSGNALTYLPLPTAIFAEQSEADVINDLGVIAGRVTPHAIVLWTNPTTPPNAFHQVTEQLEVNGINNAAEVVGTSPNSTKGFLWLQAPAYTATQAGFYHLDDFVADPAWKITRAHAINDSGQIAAAALHAGIEKAVLINLGECKPQNPPSPK
jgi:hypothetical protein